MASAKRPRLTIDSYFRKSSAPADAPADPVPSTSQGTATTVENSAAPQCPQADAVSVLPSDVSDRDIGLYVANGPKRHDIKDDETRRRLLSNPWMPDCYYPFPSVGSRKLKFQPKWQQRYSWLLYSKCQEGAFCKVCVLFGHESSGKGGHQKLGALVRLPFTRWKNALEAFQSHNDCEYHKAAVLYAAYFMEALEGETIAEQISSGARQQRQTNRKKLASIIETVIFCGRQGMPLRGHRDAGPLTLEDPIENDGNLRALLRFKIRCGDDALKEHVLTAPGNATYLSPQIQNEILGVCATLVQENIVTRVNTAKCFALLADETTDISGIEQMSVCVRYLWGGTLREDFLAFTEVTDLTGQGLASALMRLLKDTGVNTSYMCGQGYDGAANMSGRFSGVQAVIQRDVPAALYVHCASHSLNLALCSSCSVPEIRNAFGVIQEVCSFFRKSGVRSRVLREKISENSDLTKQRLHCLCETRWVERHEAIQTFLELFGVVVLALEEIAEAAVEASPKAHQLLTCVLTPTFIVSVNIAAKALSLTLALSRQLQTASSDLVVALDLIDHVQTAVSDMRNSGFPGIFEAARSMAEGVAVEIQMPRVAARQRNRPNVHATSVEEYFRIAVFLPFMDHLGTQLDVRFVNHRRTLRSLSSLLPQNIRQAESAPKAEEFSALYSSFVSVGELEGELLVWAAKCKNERHEEATSALQAVALCPVAMFPNVHRLLQILATLPVTTAEAERSFSTLRRLKTYLRASTTNDRLLGLALLNVHRDIAVSPEDVLNVLSRERRRLQINI